MAQEIELTLPLDCIGLSVPVSQKDAILVSGPSFDRSWREMFLDFDSRIHPVKDLPWAVISNSKTLKNYQNWARTERFVVAVIWFNRSLECNRPLEIDHYRPMEKLGLVSFQSVDLSNWILEVSGNKQCEKLSPGQLVEAFWEDAETIDAKRPILTHEALQKLAWEVLAVQFYICFRSLYCVHPKVEEGISNRTQHALHLPYLRDLHCSTSSSSEAFWKPILSGFSLPPSEQIRASKLISIPWEAKVEFRKDEDKKTDAEKKRARFIEELNSGFTPSGNDALKRMRSSFRSHRRPHSKSPGERKLSEERLQHRPEFVESVARGFTPEGNRALVSMLKVRRSSYQMKSAERSSFECLSTSEKERRTKLLDSIATGFTEKGDIALRKMKRLG